MKSRRRESLMVIVMVIVVAAAGLYITRTNYRAQVDYPAHINHLRESDFIVKSNIADICVGRDNLTTLEQSFGKGRFLGMSSIWEPPGKQFRVRFPKKQDTVWILETTSTAFSTYRNIKVQDTVTKVTSTYGPNYYKVSLKGNTAEYDLVYGVPSEGTVTFRLRHDRVTKLVVSRYPQH